MLKTFEFNSLVTALATPDSYELKLRHASIYTLSVLARSFASFFFSLGNTLLFNNLTLLSTTTNPVS